MKSLTKFSIGNIPARFLTRRWAFALITLFSGWAFGHWVAWKLASAVFVSLPAHLKVRIASTVFRIDPKRLYGVVQLDIGLLNQRRYRRAVRAWVSQNPAAVNAVLQQHHLSPLDVELLTGARGFVATKLEQPVDVCAVMECIYQLQSIAMRWPVAAPIVWGPTQFQLRRQLIGQYLIPLRPEQGQPASKLVLREGQPTLLDGRDLPDFPSLYMMEALAGFRNYVPDLEVELTAQGIRCLYYDCGNSLWRPLEYPPVPDPNRHSLNFFVQ